MFEGSCVALITPMTLTGEIDEDAVIALVKWQIEQGTSAIVVAGSTGESATLNAMEQQHLLKLVIATAKRQVPIIAGTGTNSTTATIERTLMAQTLGADACLIVTPYYNRPTQTGLIAHYRAVAAAAKLPILLYNVPSRTGCDILPATVATLSEIPNIMGIKEATGNLSRLAALKAECREDFIFYSGDDETACEFICQGGKGVISITTNIAPAQMQKMCQHALAQEPEMAQRVDNTLQALHRSLVVEANPIPVKWALHYLNKIQNHIRLPLTELSKEHHDKIKRALQMAGIFNTQSNLSF